MRWSRAGAWLGTGFSAIAWLLLISHGDAEVSLDDGFAVPPHAALPWVYWYFQDGKMSQAGMTADLQAMKQAGIGGGIFLEVNLGIPRGPVDFMSPRWQAMVAQAAHEADRLGIEIALGTGPGWCGTGGPWVTPEHSMQNLVASETDVTGPLAWSGTLPQPRPRAPYFGEGTLTAELKKKYLNFYRDVAVLAFPATSGTNLIADADEKALYRRDPYSSRPGVKPYLPAPSEFPTAPAGACIDAGREIDLTGKMDAKGKLGWDVPPGHWTIMRFGRTSTGQTSRPGPVPGLGFETDKFTQAALDEHFAAYIQKILSQAGPHQNPEGGITMLHFDSWEMGSQNWSADFRQEFLKRRGYDPLNYLPTLTGRIVNSVEISERFLWDLRHTAQELTIENHIAHLRDLAHERGLRLSIEPYDLNPFGDLSLGRVADVPQCEFWHLGFDTTYSVIEAASIAHTCGRDIVAGEAFTSEQGEDWKADPAALKAQGDWAFCEGVNRFDFHRMQDQPAMNQWPGMTMGHYGVHWDRTQTWWAMVSAYHEYLSRCQFLLQRGVTVADVCFLAAEGAPHVFRPPSSAVEGNPPDHTGYNFDGCAPETLLERASVKDGKLVFPNGTTYQILVLPERQTMSPGLLSKIQSLVRDGATLFGPAPVKSPSLQDYPRCDATVSGLSKEIWGDCDGRKVFSHNYGKGRVYWRATSVKPMDQYGDFSAITDILAQSGMKPDFVANGPIRYTHRAEGPVDIYFLANRENRKVEATCQFRVTGKQPELWNPMTGERRLLPNFTIGPDQTNIPMRFEPLESWFVIFRKPAPAAGNHGVNFPDFVSTGVQIGGPWNVSFDPKWGGPKEIVFASLEDWTKRTEPGIKYYSGTAVYRKAFNVPEGMLSSGKQYYLDLGAVKNLARVRMNGHDLGVVWCLPWQVNATNAIRTGENDLEIEVVNLWPNRLIGDMSLPLNQRFTSTTFNPYRKDSALLPSGLFGPVSILGSSPE
jgi:hypothetical protein